MIAMSEKRYPQPAKLSLVVLGLERHTQVIRGSSYELYYINGTSPEKNRTKCPLEPNEFDCLCQTSSDGNKHNCSRW